MLGNVGIPGLILILVVILLLFGPAKLPEIGKAVGSSLREFKKATNDIVGSEQSSQDKKDSDHKG